MITNPYRPDSQGSPVSGPRLDASRQVAFWGVAAHDRQVFRYRLDFGGGERDVVSWLEPDWVFQHGLHPEAVLAVVRDGADPVNLAPADVRENGPLLRLLSRVIA